MATVAWGSPVGGDWNTGTNWNTETVPGAGDNAAIAAGGSYTVSVSASIAADTIAISDPGAALAIADPGDSNTVAGGVNNRGALELDTANTGGSSLTIGGVLTNSGFVQIGPNNDNLTANTVVTAAGLANTGTIELDGGAGNPGAAQAVLDIAAAAPAVLTGTIELYDNSLLEFKSGQIGTILGTLLIYGGGSGSALQSYVADASNTTSDSALTGLTSNLGTFWLRGGAAVTTSGALTNSGSLELDRDGGWGGSSLTVGGVLTNGGYLQIGPGNDDLRANTVVTATGLANTGTIELDGGAGNPGASQAVLDIAAAAPAVLTGTIELYDNSLLEFKSGQIGTILGTLLIYGNGSGSSLQSYVADASSTTSDSALTGLTSNLGTFWLRGGAAVTTSGALTNSGDLELDRDGGWGGSSLTIGGVLTNTDYLQIGPGNDDLRANTTVTAAGLANTGTIELDGGAGNPGASQAVLDIAAAAPAVLTGTIDLYDNSLLEFKSGQIGTILGTLLIYGNGSGSSLQSYVADASSTTSDSALTGLTSNLGTFWLRGGAAVTTSGALTNSGDLELDRDGGWGGSSLTVGGVLTNTGFLRIGADNDDLRANTVVTATGLANTGTIDLDGGGGNPGTAQALLTVTGVATNRGTIALVDNSEIDVTGGHAFDQAGGTLTVGNGSVLVATTINITGGLLDFAGAITSGDGTGALDIGAGGTLEFAAAVDASHTVTFEAATGTLELGTPGSFAATIAGFSGSDVIDLLNAQANTLAYSSGTLTVSNSGVPIASLALTGSYTSASFTTASDGHGGTDIILTKPNPVVSWATGTSGTWTTGGNWSGGAAPGSGSDAVIAASGGYTVSSTAAISVNAIDITDPSATLFISAPGDTETVAANLVNGGTVDVDTNGGTGGTTIAVGAQFVNSGVANIGNGSLDAATTVTAAGLANTGTINLQGNNGGGTAATLSVAAAAGLGTAGVVTGTVNLYGDALLDFKSGALTTIASGATLNLQTGIGHVAAGSATTSNSALTKLAVNEGNFDLADGAAVATSTAFVNGGTVNLDDYAGSPGGSSLSVGGVLTNSGTMYIGGSGITAATTVSAASLRNTGTINLQGNGGGTAATLSVAAAAGLGTAGVVTGTVNLYGDALLDFKSGALTTIGAGATLNIQTGIGYVTAGSTTTSNSALTKLARNEGNFDLADGAAVATAAGFINGGTVNLDDYAGSPGGSSLSVGGVLTNSGTMYIGGSGITAATTVSAASLRNTGTINLQGNGGGTAATLSIAATAGLGTAGVVTGIVNLYGDALLDFKSGSLTAIASGATLNLQTGIGHVAAGSATTSNSALTKLARNEGNFDLADGAAVATAAAFVNGGTVNLDDYAGSPGGSSLSVGGVLTNSGTMYIGGSGITAATTVSAASLRNTGTINIQGNNGGGTAATLSVAAAAGLGTAGVVTGIVNLYGDALLDFKSGSLTTIASGATLNLQTGIGHVAAGSATTSNSALTKLAVNEGNFDLADGAAVATAAGFINGGTVNLDDYAGSPGGSSLSVGGVLTNSGTMNIGGSGITTATLVTAAGLSNGGTINIQGNGGGTAATLSIAAAAGSTTGGIVYGTVNLYGDALLEFKSGSLTAIASGATLNLQTGIGYVASGSATTRNSALTGLTDNAGNLDLADGATITTDADFANTGTVNIDDYASSPGGSRLSIGGVLTNSGTMNIGGGGITAATTVAAAGLANGGTVNLYGDAAAHGTLTISGAGSNTGAMTIGADAAFVDDAAYDQAAGTTTVDGTLTAPEIDVLGGTLEGTGSVAGAVVNSGGTVTAEPGTLTIDGTYSQGAGGTFETVLNGTSSFGTLAATGASIAGGTLDAQANFTLGLGDIFQVMTFAAGTVPGLFGSLAVNGTVGSAGFVTLSGGLTLGVSYNFAAGQIDLEVFATPSSNADSWNGGSGSWSTAADWSSGAPAPASDVTIGATASGKVTLNESDTVDSLTVDSGNSLVFSAGKALAVAGGLTILSGGSVTATTTGDILAIGGAGSDAGTLTLGSGDTLDVTGALTVSGKLVLSGGTIDGPGSLTVASGGTLSGSGTLGLAVVNDGAIAASGVLLDTDSVSNAGRISGGITVGGGAAGYLYNAAGGRITQAGTALTIEAGATVVNLGTIDGTGTAGVGVSFGSAAGTLVDDGTIIGASGTAVAMESGGTLVLDPGAGFTGSVTGAGIALDLSGTTPGTLTGLGTSIAGVKKITVESGASWLLSGANTIAAKSTVGGTGNLSDSGLLSNSGNIGTALTLTGSGELSNTVSGIARDAGTAIYGIGTGAAVVNRGTIASTSDTAIFLADGGTVTNDAKAQISGYQYGVRIGGSGGRVTNISTIVSADGVGVDIGNGTVTNGSTAASGATARIAGYLAGVRLYGTAGSVTNVTTIAATGLFGTGVYLDGLTDASVKNSKLIESSGLAGIGGSGGGTITNSGTVAASGLFSDGISLSGGGVITNGTAGLVEGVSAGVYLGGGGWSIANSGRITGATGIDAADDSGNVTITDAGTITGTDGTAVALGGGSDVFAMRTGGAVAGAIVGGAGNDIFEFAVGGLTASDTIVGGAGTDTLDFTTAGTIAAGVFAHVSGIDAIRLAAGTNTLTVSNALVADSDAKRLTVEGGTTDRINAAAVAAGETVVFNDDGAADTITGGKGSNVYEFDNKAGGALTIANAFTGGTAAHGDLEFGSGLTDQDLWFLKSGNNLVAEVLGTSEKVTVNGWFGSNKSAQVSEITADGLKLDSGVASLVQAMATFQSDNSSFNPTASGTTMPSDTNLQHAIAAAWHS